MTEIVQSISSTGVFRIYPDTSPSHLEVADEIEGPIAINEAEAMALRAAGTPASAIHPGHSPLYLIGTDPDHENDHKQVAEIKTTLDWLAECGHVIYVPDIGRVRAVDRPEMRRAGMEAYFSRFRRLTIIDSPNITLVPLLKPFDDDRIKYWAQTVSEMNFGSVCGLYAASIYRSRFLEGILMSIHRFVDPDVLLIIGRAAPSAVRDLPTHWFETVLAIAYHPFRRATDLDPDRIEPYRDEIATALEHVPETIPVRLDTIRGGPE